MKVWGLTKYLKSINQISNKCIMTCYFVRITACCNSNKSITKLTPTTVPGKNTAYGVGTPPTIGGS